MHFKDSFVLETKLSFTTEQFWTAVNIYLRTPQSINRRLCGSVLLFKGSFDKSCTQSFEEFYGRVASCDLSDKKFGEIFDLLKCAAELDESVRGTLHESDHAPTSTEPETSCLSRYSIIINKLLPRNFQMHSPCLEIVILDNAEQKATFATVDILRDGKKSVATKHPYSIQLVEDELHLIVHCEEVDNRDTLWLRTHVFPKLVKWASSVIDYKRPIIKSLSLVSLDAYNYLYQQLKEKYGKEMVRIWPEVTDPSKFVYEDVAIATYLLLIWENERQDKEWPEDKKQTFIDLGCGNGLLVYILSCEGHEGIGIDVRKRQIWDSYPTTTRLEVRSLNPSDDCSFPESDWLIGNHSDELTPWIPVLAARTSYYCRFFLLPCCCYDFPGTKFKRQTTSCSVYENYLNYIYEICCYCGFSTEVDKLRIPSTKRTCFIGGSKTYSVDEHELMSYKINSLIQSKCESELCFKPRPAVEKVRNCTQLKKGVVEEVVKVVADILLSDTVHSDGEWNQGGKKSVRELAELIPKEMLQELKNECGGLQTLLKNNWRVFQTKGGQVELRKPIGNSVQASSEVVSKKRKGNNRRKGIFKPQQCWFYAHHPNGCPLSASDCQNLHS